MERLRQSAVLPGGTGRGFRVSLGSERLKEGLGALLHLSVWLALLLRGTLLLEKRGQVSLEVRPPPGFLGLSTSLHRASAISATQTFLLRVCPYVSSSSVNFLIFVSLS